MAVEGGFAKGHGVWWGVEGGDYGGHFGRGEER